MNQPALSSRSWVLFTSAAVVLWSGCAGTPASQPADPGPGAQAGGSSAAGAATQGASGGNVNRDAPAAAGAGTSGSASTVGGAPSSAGAPAASAGANSAAAGQTADGGAAATGGSSSFGGASQAGAGAGGSGMPSAGAGGGVVVDPSCKLSTPVSFKKDIEPFLGTSCGNTGRSGCHVTDGSSTVNSACPDGTMKCGFDHAYDWITAGSHNQCSKTPTPIRYTVVLDVMKAAKPPSCSGSRIMPPSGPVATACQMSALAAWLAEPMTLQTHRKDDTSPAAPYMMPPFN